MTMLMENKTSKRILHRNGFTLTEAMIAMVVLVIATASIITPFSSGAAVQAEGNHRTLAAKLACDLVEQIMKTSFDQIVGTHNGHNETKGDVENAAGVVFTDPIYSNYSRSATCEYVYTPQQSGIAGTEFIRITVTVSYNGAEMATVTRLVSR